MANRRKTRAARRRTGVAELNITPFMNLMVVLIPFLLSGIVFSRLAILEMRLPTSESAPLAAKTDKEPFRLIVTLRSTGLTVLGSGIERTTLSFQQAGDDLDGLSRLLKQVKEAHPREKSVILLSEPDVPYEALIAVMDACREARGTPLFPEISVGEVAKA
ncbi:MAG: ExbD/TolR family protein [Nitrospiria bacterium]